MKLGTFKKQPRERLSKSVVYTDSLDPGDSVQLILSSQVEPEPTTEEDLNVNAALVAEDRLRLWSDGGLNGVSYKVTIIVQTLFGEVFEDELIVRVRDT